MADEDPNVTETVGSDVGWRRDTQASSGKPRAQAAVKQPVALPARYVDMGYLASGGMGEVRRVLDTKLGRELAMKITRPRMAARRSMVMRFVREASVTARLSHPGIVAVYDQGELEDGRLWYTMPEVRGGTLTEAIRSVHKASSEAAWQAGEGWSLRRLVDAFARVCQAMAYAHSREVVHRDLKPDNVMVGEFGQVLVMDWGLALDRRAAHEEGLEEHVPPELVAAWSPQTLAGQVLGTPAYMAPEQARGEPVSARTDVYALGGILFAIGVGRSPRADPDELSLSEQMAAARPAIPLPLQAIAARALQPDPEARYADAASLVEEVEAWLEDALRKEEALEIVAEAAAIEPRLRALEAEAERLEAEALEALEALAPHTPVADKVPAWRLEDRAAACRRELAMAQTRYVETLRAALMRAPELAEAHDLLAAHYRERLEAAEAQRDGSKIAQYEVLLASHDRGRHTRYLRGRGALSLIVEAGGARAEARLYRYREVDRRLVLEPAGTLGEAPLESVPLQRGSYLLELSAPGRATVRYPVDVRRGEHWDGVPPGASEPEPVLLPPALTVSEAEVVVPAGWFWAGGDPEAPDAMRRQRVWVPGFVIDRHPVTNAAYMAFLDDLVERGLEDEAARWVPRRRPAGGGDEPVYARDPSGRYRLAVDLEGDHWQADWPVTLVDWWSAQAYAKWRAARSGLPWRLPSELEWEKAARGVDGRLMPWGDQVEPTWACMLDSFTEDQPAVRASIDAYPTDESPYGVRGMAGNTRDWCLEGYRRAGPTLFAQRLSPAAGGDEEELRMVRGGAYFSVQNYCRLAGRFANRPHQRFAAIGFRLVRPLG